VCYELQRGRKLLSNDARQQNVLFTSAAVTRQLLEVRIIEVTKIVKLQGSERNRKKEDTGRKLIYRKERGKIRNKNTKEIIPL
jgi:hypothetical protein